MNPRNHFTITKRQVIGTGIVVAFLVSAVGLMVIAGILPGRMSRHRFEETKQLGNIIVTALDKHHVAHGRYPSSLEELVPEYLAAIPAPTWGTKEWKYKVLGMDGGQFVLSVGANRRNYPVLFYNSSRADWYYDQ